MFSDGFLLLKKQYMRFIWLLFCLFLVIFGVSVPEPSAAATSDLSQLSQHLWSDVNQTDIVLQGERRIIPDHYRTLALDESTLKAILATAPMEFSAAATPSEIWLPLPDGNMERFHFVESPIMEPGLQAKYPEIKSYVARGIDDPTAYSRFGWTYKGFHGIIFSDQHPTVFIDAYSINDTIHYISYFRTDYSRAFAEPFVQQEPLVDPEIAAQIADIIASGQQPLIGEQLRTYRLALAATGEYSTFHGGTKPLVLSEMVIAMNRVNGVYEQDTAVRMVLIANNDAIIYLNGASDPYTNNNGSTMLGQNQSNLDTVIGTANYDIGHVFSTGGGGVAYLGVPCRAGWKAGGVTGLSSPSGDPFYIDYVAHEMGHQFGANHTFNGNAGSCAGGNRNASTAYEPGSGTTIMAYAGICSPQDIQNNSDDHFHTHSIQEIVAYTTAGSGNTCPVTTSTGNNAPTAEAGTGGFTIPINTPFILTGSATDPNSNDVLSYNWEEYDLGSAGHPNSPVGNAPIFRSFPSVFQPFRYFPRISDIVNNTQTMGEILPSYTRSLNFRLTVRDNNQYPSAGGVHYDLITFSVTNQAGPFLVTAPNTAIVWDAGFSEAISWNVANTTAAPVSCANVDINLSTDGGYTYPITLATNTPNDGTEMITVPNNVTAQARVMVKCATNVFFDISNVNFTIQNLTPYADLDLSKTVTPAGPVAPGTPLTYTIVVTNAGTLAASTTITDTFPMGVVNPVCNSVPGDINTTVNIAAASLTTFNCTAQVASDISIDLSKTVDQTVVNAGDTVTYTIVVTNTSPTYTLTDVVVSDPNVSGCSPVLSTPITLAPLASQTYICPNVVINATTTNTATVTGHFIIINEATASAPQDTGGPVSDNALSDVTVTASDSVTVTTENQIIFIPLLFRD
ncbi:MAG: DUF11 domain-containing protein [Chloroflexi bacterium]|nr:DUF11 domain-containing protein [Chloroflexota bacterium]